MLAPFAGTPPEGSESIGLFVGPGDQDNFVRLALAANGGAPQLELSSEVGGVATTASAPVSLADISTIDLYLTVDPSLDTITARFRVTTTTDTGPLTDVASVEGVPVSWLDNATQGLAVGLIATSAGGLRSR